MVSCVHTNLKIFEIWSVMRCGVIIGSLIGNLNQKPTDRTQAILGRTRVISEPLNSYADRPMLAPATRPHSDRDQRANDTLQWTGSFTGTITKSRRSALDPIADIASFQITKMYLVKPRHMIHAREWHCGAGSDGSG